MYPFETKIGKKKFVKLHKELYSRNLINKIKKEIPDSIISLKSQKDYHLLELEIDGTEDYFDFCNCLIYFDRSA